MSWHRMRVHPGQRSGEQTPVFALSTAMSPADGGELFVPLPAGRAARAAWRALASLGRLRWRTPAERGEPPGISLSDISVLVVPRPRTSAMASELADELRASGIGKVTVAPAYDPPEGDARELLGGYDLVLVFGDGSDPDARLAWERFAASASPEAAASSERAENVARPPAASGTAPMVRAGSPRLLHATIAAGAGWIGPVGVGSRSLTQLLHLLEAAGECVEANDVDVGPGLVRTLAAHLGLAAERQLNGRTAPSVLRLEPSSGRVEWLALPDPARPASVRGRLGPLLGTPDEGIEQVPIGISVAVGTDQGRRLPPADRRHAAPGYGETPARARELATRAAAARTALLALAADPTSRFAGPDASSPSVGGAGFVPAIDLVHGSWVRVHRDRVFDPPSASGDRTSPGIPGPPSAADSPLPGPPDSPGLAAGLAAEPGWDRSIDVALASACRYRTLRRLLEPSERTSARADGASLSGWAYGTVVPTRLVLPTPDPKGSAPAGSPDDPDTSASVIGRLLAVCAALWLDPVLLDVTGPEGVPTVVGSDPTLPQVCAAALDPSAAVADALLQLLALAQLGDRSTDPEGTVPGSGGVRWSTVLPESIPVRIPVPRHARELGGPVSRFEVLARLAGEGLRAYAVPLRSDPVLAAAFPYAVRVLLTSDPGGLLEPSGGSTGRERRPGFAG